MRRPAATGTFPVLLGLVVLLGVWELAALAGGTKRHVIPQPGTVLATMTRDHFYGASLATTGWEAARGFLIGNVIALLLASVCVIVPAARRTLTRLAAASYCAPAVAIGPLFVVLLDPDKAKVIISALSVVFISMTGAVLGLSSAPKSALELVHVTGGRRMFALLRVRLRAAVPTTAAAIGLSAPAALLGAIVGEYLGGDRGLGVAMVQAQQSLEVPRAWALALLATLVSGAAYVVISLIARRFDFAVVTSEMSGPAMDAGSRRGPLKLLGGIVAAVAGTGLVWWGLVKSLGLDPYLAKTPQQVISYLASGAHQHVIGASLLTTLRDAGTGYLVGTVIAVVAAALLLGSQFAEAMFLPIALALRSIPLVAMTPLVALVFGRGLVSVTVLASTITLVPTVVNVVTALRRVPEPAQDLLHVYDLGPLRSMISVRMRYAVPALAASARLAIPGALLGAVLAEFLVTGDGLGQLIAVSTINSDFLALWSAVAVVTIVSVTLYSVLSQLEDTFSRRLY
jgi:sulfonate transport system permease protein